MDISIEHAIVNYFNQWLGSHPYLAWIIAHPLWSLGLLFLTIFSLWGLIKAIGRGIEQIWLFLLTTPFKMLQPILKLVWSSIRQIFGHNNSNAEPSGSPTMSDIASTQIDAPAATQCQRILDRLQTLHQEQEILMGELSTLVNSTSVRSNVETISDTQYRNLSAKLPKFNQL